MSEQNPKRQTNLEWLQERVSYQGDECVIWVWSKIRGYGQLGIGGGRMAKAHRLMCEMAHGPAPTDRHQAAHECGNRSCVNPRHLAWKTPSENSFDRRRHGTAATNRYGRRSKLTKAQVAEIRALKGQYSQVTLGKMFGVSNATIYDIHKGDTHAAHSPDQR